MEVNMETKMKKMTFALLSTRTLVLSATLLLASTTFAGSKRDAQKLKQGVAQAKSRIQRVLSHGPHSGGGHFLTLEERMDEMESMVAMDEQPEKDGPALDRLLQASMSLEEAAEYAEKAEDAFDSGSIQYGNYQFGLACSKAAISRSRIARANVMAMQPPVGWLQAFSSDLTDVVDELQDLKMDVGCP